ncbi:hypothetical protein [Burkholderia sp. LMG 32019]
MRRGLDIDKVATATECEMYPIYRETDDTIDVIRILHQRMDIERHL